jgi:hypothetical protein
VCLFSPSLFLYKQTAQLDVFLNRQIIEASTCLWIAYDQSVQAGDILRLHCRQCAITEITINNIPISPQDWECRDGLQNLLPLKKKEHSGGVLDQLYRLALEISREGELQIKIPDLLESKFTAPTPLPVPGHSGGSAGIVMDKEVTKRQGTLKFLFDQLVGKSVVVTETVEPADSERETGTGTSAGTGTGVGTEREKEQRRVSRSAYDVDDDESDEEDKSDALHTTGANESTTMPPKPQKRKRREVYLLQVRIKYQIADPSVALSLSAAGAANAATPGGGSSSSSTTCGTSGVIFRQESPFIHKFDKHYHHKDQKTTTGSSTANTSHHTSKHVTGNAPTEATVCCYTSSSTNGMLRDVDGVRCWLPCLDFLDQRGSFDLTVRAKFGCHIVASGVKIDQFVSMSTAHQNTVSSTSAGAQALPSKSLSLSISLFSHSNSFTLSLSLSLAVLLYLSLFISLSLSLSLSRYLSLSIYLSVSLSICISLSLYVCIYLSISIYLSICHSLPSQREGPDSLQVLSPPTSPR